MKIKIILSVFVLGLIGYGFFIYFEMTSPSAEWLNTSEYLGRDAVLKIALSDRGRGLKEAKVTFRQGGKDISLYSEDYSVRKPALKEEALEVSIDFDKLGIRDGKGVVTLSITDRSLWWFGKGNRTRFEYNVTVDTVPPMIEVLSSDHVVLQGGAEAAVYRTSPDAVTAGVKVGEYFFPGYNGLFQDGSTYLTLFSYPYSLSKGEAVFIIVKDRAGNTSKKALSILVKPKDYRKSTINLTDDFLKEKLPEVISFAGLKGSGEPLKDFLLINRELRSKNEQKIKEVTANSLKEVFWKGGFLQLKNAKVESNFADFRTYTYDGKVIDRQYHLGYDLAATKRYPVAASNNGKVVFAGNLGIYGNTVIIDHGLGISTLYAHMSSIDVNEGEVVEKGRIIGRTGDTGLAGGDHLHFGIYINGVPVIPLEWWDERWVENRILRRIEAAGG